MMRKLFTYLVIPAYTVLFTRGYGWLTTNFSVIGNLLDKKHSFFLWGVTVGVYFWLTDRRIKSHLSLGPVISRLIPAALALLFCAITTPYLPEELPLKSFLHIIFAFISTVLLLLYLAAVAWDRSRLDPARFRPFLAALAAIVLVSAVLFAVAGIISSALEIFITITTVVLSDRICEQVARP